MRQTAKGMVENLLGLVQQFGFVPNGRLALYCTSIHLTLLILSMYVICNVISVYCMLWLIVVDII
jgi:hypothetical protein